MKISTNPPTYLSNKEVLDHFLSLKEENDSLQSLITNKTRRQQALNRSQYPVYSDRGKEYPHIDDFLKPTEAERKKEDVAERRGVSDESVWIQEEVIRYLCADYNMTAKQTSEGVALLADQLQDHDLTKGEVLQICNLAPVLPVELYCIIEEVDTRFQPNPSTRLEQIANQVQSTLLPTPPIHLEPFVTITEHAPIHQDIPNGHDHEYTAGVVHDVEGMEEEVFVHEAEWGVGKEDGVGEEREGDMD